MASNAGKTLTADGKADRNSARFQGVVLMASDRGCESSPWSQFGVESG